jgi:predicted Zn-dependent protease
MTRRNTPEVAHTAYTDHRVRIPKAKEPQADARSRILRPWRKAIGDGYDRSLGLAYVYAGQREESSEWVQRGFTILISLPEVSKDPEVLSALGMVLLQKQRPKEAAAMFSKSVSKQPEDAHHHHNLGVSLITAGEIEAGIKEIERAVAIDPLSQQSWLFLAQVHRQQGRLELWKQTLERFLKYVPQSLPARAALRANDVGSKEPRLPK